jgi:hypothetical protein
MKKKQYLDALKENKILKEQKVKLAVEAIEEEEHLEEFGPRPGAAADRLDARSGLLGSVGGFNLARKERVARIKQKAKAKAFPLMKKKWAAQAKKEKP